MTIVLGIDPGATTGWCAYDATARRTLASGQFPGHEVSAAATLAIGDADCVVIERPKGYGPTRPPVVDCAWVAGRLFERVQRNNIDTTHELTRIDVKNALRDATHGEVSVKTDAGVWAALLLLHGGDDAAKKGGPLHGVKSHERAALAVAVAFWITQGAAQATA
jgi:hypothetical protein